jgi:hypothetical protein
VASHDAKAFAEPLARLARQGVHAVVLGFRERAGYAAGHPDLDFVDLEDVPGAFARPLPRTNLFDLPSAGRWFAPFVEVRPWGAPGADDDAGPGQRTDAAPDADAGGAPEPPGPTPSRGDVVRLVIDEVGSAVASGAPGLPLQRAGELLRDRFPGFSLEDAGFRSHTDLVEELVATGELDVARTDAGGHLLRPAVIDLTEGPAPAAEAPEAEVGPGHDAVEPADEPPGTDATEPPTAEAGPAPPEAGELVHPEDGPNPIYKMFGYRPPGTGAA